MEMLKEGPPLLGNRSAGGRLVVRLFPVCGTTKRLSLRVCALPKIITHPLYCLDLSLVLRWPYIKKSTQSRTHAPKFCLIICVPPRKWPLPSLHIHAPPLSFSQFVSGMPELALSHPKLLSSQYSESIHSW